MVGVDVTLSKDNCLLVWILLDDSHKAILLSEREFAAWQETDYLLSNPANAAHLRKSLEQARTGHVAERELLD